MGKIAQRDSTQLSSSSLLLLFTKIKTHYATLRGWPKTLATIHKPAMAATVQAPPAYNTILHAKPTEPPSPPHGSPAHGTPIAGIVNHEHAGSAPVAIQRLTDAYDLDYETACDFCSMMSETEMVVIADDSGSMGNRSTMQGQPTVKTRWHELQFALRKLLDILTFLDKDGGFELQFLNSNSRRPLSIRSSEDLEQCWSFAKPGGGTPLLSTLQPYLENKRGTERVVMVLTDGCPSDGTFERLRGLLAGKDNGVYVNFVMCTDDDEVVDRYEDSIDAVPCVDVHDDYQSEQAQVVKCGGTLNFNKYLAKCVMGAKFPKYDMLDDKKLGTTGAECACSIM